MPSKPKAALVHDEVVDAAQPPRRPALADGPSGGYAIARRRIHPAHAVAAAEEDVTFSAGRLRYYSHLCAEHGPSAGATPVAPPLSSTVEDAVVAPDAANCSRRRGLTEPARPGARIVGGETADAADDGVVDHQR
jgi:hypothetical protein